MPVGACGRFEAGFSDLIRCRLFQRFRNPKIQPKGCASPRFALDVNKAVLIFHDSVDYRKPQSCSLTHFFSSEERLENTLFNSLSSPHPGIAPLNTHITPV